MEAKRQERLEMIQRLFRLIHAINETGRGAIKDKTLARYCLDSGVGLKRANEYLHLLLLGDMIDEKGGELWVRESDFKEEEK